MEASQYSGTAYQAPPAAHQPQPAHQSQPAHSYERHAAYQQYAQHYAQQTPPPTSAAPTYTTQGHHTAGQQQQAPAAHSSYNQHAAPATTPGQQHPSHHQAGAGSSSSLTYAQQAAAAQYNAQMLANYASVANMGAHVGRGELDAGRGKPSPQKTGKRKRSKDPNRPKRPTSAYFFYIQHCREECEKRGERITRVAQWTKEMSAVWRALSAEDKVPYDNKAVVDKQRYEDQMNKYKGRDKNRPKRPQSAYFLWLAGFRERMKEKIPVNKELLRAAGENWKKLTETEKAPYEQMAEVERRKYEEAMRQYNMNGGGGGSGSNKKPCLEEGSPPPGHAPSSSPLSPSSPPSQPAMPAQHQQGAMSQQASLASQQHAAASLASQQQAAASLASQQQALASQQQALASQQQAASLASHQQQQQQLQMAAAAGINYSQAGAMHPTMMAAMNMMNMHQQMGAHPGAGLSMQHMQPKNGQAEADDDGDDDDEFDDDEEYEDEDDE